MIPIVLLLEGITYPEMHQDRLKGDLNGMNGMGWFENLNANRPLNVVVDGDLCVVRREKIVVVERFDGLIAIGNLLALTYDDLDYCIPEGMSEAVR